MEIEYVLNSTNIEYLMLDIYGSLVAQEDDIGEDEIGLPHRDGIYELSDYCKKKNKQIISSSDENNIQVKIDLQYAGILHPEQIFSQFHQFGDRYSKEPKDFRGFAEKHNINPVNMLVAGDSYEKDIKGAINSGCSYIHIPFFKGVGGSRKDFDYRKIIDLLEN